MRSLLAELCIPLASGICCSVSQLHRGQSHTDHSLPPDCQCTVSGATPLHALQRGQHPSAVQAQQIMQRVAPLREQRRRLDAKVGLLRTLQRNAPASVTQLDGLDSSAAQWDALLAGLAQFESNLEAQKGSLAQQVAGNVARFQQQVAALQARWQGVKPSGACCLLLGVKFGVWGFLLSLRVWVSLLSLRLIRLLSCLIILLSALMS